VHGALIRVHASIFACVHLNALCIEDQVFQTNRDCLQVCQTAVNAGATTLNIADTVGYVTPSEFKELIQAVKQCVNKVCGLQGLVRSCIHCCSYTQDVTVSAHGHNDLGMAVANFMAAIEGGVRQVECTINGTHHL
jgi:2-isopropylmalate synthase